MLCPRRNDSSEHLPRLSAFHLHPQLPRSRTTKLRTFVLSKKIPSVHARFQAEVSESLVTPYSVVHHTAQATAHTSRNQRTPRGLDTLLQKLRSKLVVSVTFRVQGNATQRPLAKLSIDAAAYRDVPTSASLRYTEKALVKRILNETCNT